MLSGLSFRNILRMPMQGSRNFAALILIAVSLAGCQTELYSGLNERDAADSIVVLNSNQISVSRKSTPSGTTLLVDDSDQARAIQILSDAGLPKQPFQSLGQVFSGSGIVSTPTEERARLMYALGEEVSQSIGRIEGIQSARAHISIPEKDRIGGVVVSPRASIYVYYRSGNDISSLIPSIKTLVVNSVEGMNYEDVAVQIFPSQEAALSASNRSGLGSSSLSFTTILIFLTCCMVLAGLARHLLGSLVSKPS